MDGQEVFSKHKAGRFPTPGEVAGIIKGLQETPNPPGIEDGYNYQ